MGATSSNTKRYANQFHSNIYSTPPKINNGGIHNRLVQLQCDPRSPTGNNKNISPIFSLPNFITDGISRTPIQIDSPLPIPPLKLYNHVMPHIVGPDIIISEVDDKEDNQENKIHDRQEKLDVIGQDSKRSSGIEPTLDPSKVLTALVANNDGQLPPYQL